MGDFRLVTTDSPEFRKIKIDAILNKEEYLLSQLKKIKEWGGKKVRLILDFEDLLRLYSIPEENQADEAHIFLDKPFWEVLRSSVNRAESDINPFDTNPFDTPDQ